MTTRARDVLGKLGELSVDEFMRRHWQRKPALIRAALPGWQSPVSREVLFDLALRDDVTARLITRRGPRWTLRSAPLEALPSTRSAGWTVLVNGVDRHLDAAHALLRRFRFLPDARLDDLMASYATRGGGVGPHVDSYDVFLLQAQGRRRWRVAPPGDATRVADAPLKLLAHFEPELDWVLEPGDMLYVPPGWGHEGTALEECITLSIGFRAPSRHDFLAAFLAASADEPGGPDPRFGDPSRPCTTRPGQLPDDLSRKLIRWAGEWRPSRAQIERFTGCFLTEPASDVWFDAPASVPSRTVFEARAAGSGVLLDRRTRMAWRGSRVFINGECLEPEPGLRRWLRELADARELVAPRCQQALQQSGLSEQLHAWLAHGWLHLGAARR